MTELEKIEYAKGFIDKLAEGINPLDDMPIADGELLNNVRISRCMYFVSDILRLVIENGGIERKKPVRKNRRPFALGKEARSSLAPSDSAVRVSELTQAINSCIDQNTMKGLRSGAISSWLTEIGALEEVELPSGKKSRLPTPQGLSLGILTQERQGQNGTYTAVLYSPRAQQFIFDNIEAVEQHSRERPSLKK